MACWRRGARKYPHEFSGGVSILKYIMKTHPAHQVKGEINRFVLLELKAFQFTCIDALAGGVTTSLEMYFHEKA